MLFTFHCVNTITGEFENIYVKGPDYRTGMEEVLSKVKENYKIISVESEED